MYLAALGDLAESMQADDAAAELSLSIFFLGLCVGQLFMGPLLDSFGRKGPLIGGTVLFAVTSFALVQVEDIILFNTLRFFQALGACAGMVVSRAVVYDLYEGRRAAKVMTVLVMLLTIGPIISPTLGSLLLQGFGWRSIFVVMTLVSLVALVLSLFVIPETLPRKDRVAAPFQSGRKTAAILMTRPDFVKPTLIAGLVQGGMFAFITGSSGVFQGVFGLTSLSYGLLFAGIAVALLLFGQVNTLLLNRYFPAQILKTGLPVYAAATLILTLASGTQTLWIFVVPLWISIGMVGLLSANAMSMTMTAAQGGSVLSK
jgi:DHA1 family bicyclomycin/chloramphenicol resistance-like MFS transporter